MIMRGMIRDGADMLFRKNAFWAADGAKCTEIRAMSKEGDNRVRSELETVIENNGL